MSEGQVPTGPGWWWLNDHGTIKAVEVVRNVGSPFMGRSWDLAWWGADENGDADGCIGWAEVTADGCWLAPVLTPAEAAALTAERDEARQWAEAAAADENANAAELREARATLDAVRAALGNGADEATWPPGQTMAEAVAGLRAECDRLRVLLGFVPKGERGPAPSVSDFDAIFNRSTP